MTKKSGPLRTKSNIRGSKIRAEYFVWLVDFLSEDCYCDYAQELETLCSILHDIPFKWSLWRDDNIAAYGTELRDAFLNDSRYSQLEDVEELDKPCSVFEALCGLCERWYQDVMFEYDKDRETGLLFEELIENLGLGHCLDSTYGEKWDLEFVHKVVENWLERTFEPDGFGSPFPIKNPKNLVGDCVRGDQRKVDIWYQLTAYWQENHPFDADLDEEFWID